MEHKQYLYIRVVKGRDLFVEDVTGVCARYVEVRVGNCKETTRCLTLSKTSPKPEWNQVLAFLIGKTEATMLEISVKDKDAMKDDFIGWVLHEFCEIPVRVKPDSPLAPQWYRLADRKGDKIEGELMFALWWGTQTDEALCEVDSVREVNDLGSIHSKVYFQPVLWYLRVNVIEVQDLIPDDRTRLPESFVKATLGNQSVKTRVSTRKSVNPFWNEELMFVAAEPFEDHLILSVEDRVAPNKDEFLGMCVIPLRYVERRIDHRAVRAMWFNLQKDVNVGGQKTKQAKFSSRIHMSICLEGGYHVLHGSTQYSSDFRPAAKQLWKKSIGILEFGILSAHGLLPMKTEDGRATTDAYCVAKYGTKWVRTKTIINSFAPKWNEQYTWEVYDPCTIITIGVFDNNFHLQGGDKSIGKVRIRVSTLETDRIYTHTYPLLVLQPSGVKKTGEIQLALRFTCSSLLNMMHMYSQPLLPEMHYIHPLSVTQLDRLRHHATQIVSTRLSQGETPLRKEIVEYMLDVDCDNRQSKANFLRIKGVLVGLIAMGNWFGEMYSWKNSVSTVVIHVIFLILAMYPELILSSIFLFLFVIEVWNYIHRPRYPPDMDAHLACADNAHHNEELDTFQRVVGDIATQGEKLQSLLNWRDPRATSLFVTFCLIAAVVMYVTPLYVVVIQTVIYVLNHLCFQKKLPSVPVNFFGRLPARTDSML